MCLQKFRKGFRLLLGWELSLKEKLKYVFGASKLKFKLAPGIMFNIHRKAFIPFAHFTSLSPEAIEEMKAFLRLTPDKKCLLDVGALYGIFSLAFTSGKNSVAYAIEPSQKPFDIICYHTKINSLCNIKLFQLAFGSSEGKLKMKYEWQHLVAIGQEETRYSVEVNVNRLDNFVMARGIAPDVIKIDTEGFEYEVLKGAENYLKANKPIVFLEVHIPWLNKHGINAQQLVDLIYSLGYKIYNLNGTLLSSPSQFFNEHPNARVICSKEIIKA